MSINKNHLALTRGLPVASADVAYESVRIFFENKAQLQIKYWQSCCETVYTRKVISDPEIGILKDIVLGNRVQKTRKLTIIGTKGKVVFKFNYTGSCGGAVPMSNIKCTLYDIS